MTSWYSQIVGELNRLRLRFVEGDSYNSTVQYRAAVAIDRVLEELDRVPASAMGVSCFDSAGTGLVDRVAWTSLGCAVWAGRLRDRLKELGEYINTVDGTQGQVALALADQTQGTIDSRKNITDNPLAETPSWVFWLAGYLVLKEVASIARIFR